MAQVKAQTTERQRTDVSMSTSTKDKRKTKKKIDEKDQITP
jgi:hypothetical protein